mmetsp:Transcript_65455/g.105704  ORF Transcript_65455/g.105704 Transcript_65455/m.105704 type:complete len:224 (+) Transcript_65455:289-960(+)
MAGASGSVTAGAATSGFWASLAGATLADGALLVGAPVTAAVPWPITPIKHPARGMSDPSAYKESFKDGTSSREGGRRYRARTPSRRTTPARCFDLKYLQYSSKLACSIMLFGVSCSIEPVAILFDTSSKGTLCVMSRRLWLPAADRRATSTSWTLPWSKAARTGRRLPMFRARVSTPVQAAATGGGAVGGGPATPGWDIIIVMPGIVMPCGIVMPGIVCIPIG